jgi:hypothetical protein
MNQLIRRKGLFWLTVLEGSVHGQLAALFWSCSSTAWWELMEKQTTFLMAEKVKKRKIWSWCLTVLFKGTSIMT